MLRQRLLLQHLAQSGKGELERRLAVLGWQGNDGFLRAALERRRAAMAGAGPRRRPLDAAREAAPQPAGLARRALQAGARRRVLAAGRERSSNRRRSTCGSTR